MGSQVKHLLNILIIRCALVVSLKIANMFQV